MTPDKSRAVVVGDPAFKKAGNSPHISFIEIDEMIEETILIRVHHIRFGTVNLAAPSSTIRTQLMQIIEINTIDI